jgi:hypothetical protein
MSCANTHRALISTAHSFCTMHQYQPRAVFVPHTDIPHAFHSTCCTIPKVSMPHHTPILCAHHSLNCRATTFTHIVRATTILHYIVPTLYTPRVSLLCVCTLRNAKFITTSCTPTFFRMVLKFSVHAYTLTFSRTAPKFSTCTCTLTFFCTVPKFSVRTNTPIYCRIVPNFTYHKVFTAHHVFLVRPSSHTHFYAQ